MMWLEILDHLELARRLPVWDPLKLELYVGDSRQTIIERHLRLIDKKLKASDFLLRLNEFKAQCPWPSGNIIRMPDDWMSASPDQLADDGKNEPC